jgi:hypothetical protein
MDGANGMPTFESCAVHIAAELQSIQYNWISELAALLCWQVSLLALDGDQVKNTFRRAKLFITCANKSLVTDASLTHTSWHAYAHLFLAAAGVGCILIAASAHSLRRVGHGWGCCVQHKLHVHTPALAR